MKLLPRNNDFSELLDTGLQPRSLNPGLGKGLQQLAESNLDRMLGKHNYFQQNLSQALQDLGINPTRKGISSLLTQQPTAQPVAPSTKESQNVVEPEQIKNELPKLTTKEKAEQKKIEFAQKKLEKEQEVAKKQLTKEQREEQKGIDKETLPFYKDTLKSEKAAVENDLRLNRMEELVTKGSLPVSHFYRLFKSLSEADIGKAAPIVGPLAGLFVNPVLNLAGGILLAGQRSITSTDMEEFEKLSNDFVKNVKEMFGARVTQGEVERYLKTIPTLEQTDAGKLKVIRNLKSFNKVTELRAKAMKDIIKENDGNRPKNLEILVDERIAPILDEIALEFKVGAQPYPSF